LAESLLAPSAQTRLDELLARNAESQLSSNEQSELDRLLERIDNLTILKTRARYTLHHQQAEATQT
jgi:ribosome assembly protein YihI (activator of Der GTPase)